jgi:hypothetical protein
MRYKQAFEALRLEGTMIMITDQQNVELDEDNWDLEKGKDDCPNGQTYIWIPSIIDGQKKTLHGGLDFE